MRTNVQGFVKGNFNFMYRVARQANRDDCWGMAGEIGFALMFALFTGLILMVAFLSIFGAKPDVLNSILYFLASFLPFELYTLIRREIVDIAQTDPKGIVTLGIAGTIWTISNLMMILNKCFQRSYNVKETRSFWKLRLISLALACTVALFVALVLNLLAFGIQIARFIEQNYGYQNIIALLIRAFRLPVAFILTTLLTSLLYWAMSNVRQGFFEVMPGALFFGVLWFVCTYGFGYYLKNFPHYNATYGTLGAGLILMIWMYLTALSLLLGGEVNAEIYHRRMLLRHRIPASV